MVWYGMVWYGMVWYVTGNNGMGWDETGWDEMKWDDMGRYGVITAVLAKEKLSPRYPYSTPTQSGLPREPDHTIVTFFDTFLPQRPKSGNRDGAIRVTC